MRCVFLTGATGFVGSHTARLFLKEGWRVRALVRRLKRPGLLPNGVETIEADLLDSGRYLGALEGCDAVVHVAGLTKARTLDEYRGVNRDGAASVAQAAARVCPKAIFVHVSSQSAAGPSRAGRPVAESDAAHPISWYGISKLEGERAIEANFPGPRVIVRPSVVYGAGDPGLLQLFAIVARGIAPILAGGKGRIQLIAAEDLARVLVACANRADLSGRKGFAAADAVAMGEVIRYVARLRVPPAREVPIPAFAIRAAGILESIRESITRRSRPFNRDKAREMLQAEWLCESSPFLSELGVADLRGWKQGLSETIAWYVRQGWLPASFGQL